MKWNFVGALTSKYPPPTFIFESPIESQQSALIAEFGQRVNLAGLAYGVVLWILTLVPIHKPITGFSPWNHPLGHLPALASLSGHILYGIVLGVVVVLIK
ncbi:MAG: phosphosulfolactate synthase [Candidatus Nitrosopolaris sp.]